MNEENLTKDQIRRIQEATEKAKQKLTELNQIEDKERRMLGNTPNLLDNGRANPQRLQIYKQLGEEVKKIKYEQ